MNKSSVQDVIYGSVFWRLAVIFSLMVLAVCGLIPSFITLLRDVGLSAEAAGGFMGVLGLSVIVARFITGFLVDRIFAPYVISFVFFSVAIGLYFSDLAVFALLW